MCSGIHHNLTVLKVISIKSTNMQSKCIEPIHPSDHNMETRLKQLDIEVDNYTKYNILRPDCAGYADENEYDPDHNYSLYSYIYETVNTINRHEQLCNAVTVMVQTMG